MRRIFALALLPLPALADAPVVEGVSARQSGQSWSFSVTLRHPDTGWDDYADGWRVEDLEGGVLGTRDLLHPHVTEQPFTRALSGVALPEGAAQVRIRARDSVGGWSEDATLFTLP